MELDGGASEGGLGNKALRRPPLLRRVQDILRIPEDALDSCMGLKIVLGGVFGGAGACFEMERLTGCWQGVT